MDFKTDQVTRPLGEVAEPYLSQLGLYGLALEAGQWAPDLRSRSFSCAPARCLCRAGREVGTALELARERVDAGALLDPDAPEYIAEGALAE